MSYKVINLQCPSCGSMVNKDIKKCEYCGRIIEITSTKDFGFLDESEANQCISEGKIDKKSLGYCYFKLGLFNKAKQCFLESLDTNIKDGALYFALALVSLGNKKPFLHIRDEINQIEEYIQTAIDLDDNPAYYFMYAYVRYDYHHRKFFNISPGYIELLNEALSKKVNEEEIYSIFDCLKLELPSFK